MKYFKFLINIINVASFLLMVLYISIMLPTFNYSFYRYQYEKHDIKEVLKISEEDIEIVTRHMLQYLRDGNDDIQVIVTIDGNTREFFNEREIYHMIDVKNLFIGGRVLRNVATVTFLLTLLIIFYIEKSFLLLIKTYKNLLSGLLIAILLFICLIAIDFETSFLIFHEIFFTNDLYLLNPNVDLLINLVPLEFFIDISILISTIFLFIICVTIFIARLIIKSKKVNILNR